MKKKILRVVVRLSSIASTDCNDISMVLVKNYIESTIQTFNYICNKSFEFDIFPDDMKISKVIPVIKAGKKSKLIITGQ